MIRTAIGERLYVNPAAFIDHDFATDGMANWFSGARDPNPRQLIENGAFVTLAPGPDGLQDDLNHKLVGITQHGIMLDTPAFENIGGFLNPYAAPNVEMEIELRGVNWNPGNSTPMTWLQSRLRGGYRVYSNFGLPWPNGNALLTSGAWEVFRLVLTDDETEWLFGGGPGTLPWAFNSTGDTLYGYQTVADALENISNFFFLAFGFPVGGQRPTGRIETRRVYLPRLTRIAPTSAPPPGELIPVIPTMTGPTTGGVTMSASANCAYPAWQHDAGLSWVGFPA